MNEAQAAALTDQIIGKLLTHQENALGTYPLNDESQARFAAKSIAAFRLQLIEELKTQPQ